MFIEGGSYFLKLENDEQKKISKNLIESHCETVENMAYPGFWKAGFQIVFRLPK